ncbi:MAG: hypothetical protein MUC96_00210 [Myxococcaceae bacterium]|jgi:hypothetical protein|nr:hypothetical protein [Myxococcaceae bacterium]
MSARLPLHRLLTATLALTLCNCAIIRLPGISLGGAPASSGGEASALPSRFSMMSEADIATMGVKRLLGELHQVSGYESAGEGNYPVAKGTFAFSDAADEKAFEQRFIALVAKNRKVSEWDLVEKVLPKEFCENQVRLAVIKGRTAAQAEALCQEHPESLFRVSAGRSDRGLAVLFLDALLPSLPDDKARDAATLKMAQSLGWKVKDYRIRRGQYEHDAGWGYALEAQDLKTWNLPTLSFALAYARAHQGASSLVASLEAAASQAPKERCFWALHIVVQDGSGTGPIRYEPRFSVTGQKTTDDLSCTELPKVKSDADLLKVMKSDYKSTYDLTAVHAFDKDWVVERNALGVPVRRSLVVKSYLVERFAP